MATKIKNLEEEVDLIISEDENDVVERRITRRRSDIPKTQPRVLRNTKALENSPQVAQIVPQTPRRSTRKSVRPTQEYDEIVKKSASKKLNIESDHSGDENQPPQPKWTPAKVGRFSAKRKSRNKKSSAAKTATKEETEGEEEEEKNVPEENKEKLVADDKGEQENEQNTKKNVKRSKRNRAKSVKKNLSKIEDSETTETDQPEETDVEVHQNDVPVEGHMQVQQNNVASVVAVEKTAISVAVEEVKSEEKIEPQEQADKQTDGVVEVHVNEDVTITDSKGESQFGSYLKAFQNDLDDLGLIPLKESIENNNQTPETSQAYEDMPTLVIDDIAEDDNAQSPPSPTNSSDTFNVSDCIVVANSPERLLDGDSNSDMLTLQISDDEEDQPTEPDVAAITKKPPSIVLTNPNSETIQLVGSPMAPLCEVTSSAKFGHRMPTPHKKRNTVIEELEAIEPSAEDEPQSTVVELSVTTLEPKEIILQGIRKRSLSMTIGDDATKRSKGVRFYSPANQTICCEVIDKQLAKSIKKSQPSERAEFVTQRRKRSMSFDETIASKISGATPSKIQRPTTPKSANKNVTTRGKIPNFAAIHEKQFKKMENIVEHMQRKTERAKLLTNSATKLKSTDTASAQKLFSPRNVNTATNRSRAAVDDKPKALKRINLDSSNNKSFTKTVGGAGDGILNRGNELHSLHDDLDSLAATNLGNTRLAYIKPAPTGKKIIYEATAKATTAKSSLLPRSMRKVLKPSLEVNAPATKTTATATKGNSNTTIEPKKPLFNLSTQLTSTKTASNIFSTTLPPAKLNMSSIAPKSRIPVVNPKPAATQDDIVAARRQRHMDMFKGRSANSRVGLNATKTSNVQIRGVRSNRRFELQMQHRLNNMENNN